MEPKDDYMKFNRGKKLIAEHEYKKGVKKTRDESEKRFGKAKVLEAKKK